MTGGLATHQPLNAFPPFQGVRKIVRRLETDRAKSFAPFCPLGVNGTITAKDGLLWRNGVMIPLPEADLVANAHGYLYAEQLVRALEDSAKGDTDV